MALNASISSEKALLTDEQIGTLNRHLDEFEAADYGAREEIVKDFLGSFKRACPKGVVFDKTTVLTVSEPSAALGYSYTFLGYSAAPL